MSTGVVYTENNVYLCVYREWYTENNVCIENGTSTIEKSVIEAG